MKLNLGSGVAPVSGFTNVDIVSDPRVDFVFDLNYHPWPWDSESVDEVRAYHFMEHVRDLYLTMVEIHRICKRDALVDIIVPYANTAWAVANYDHKHQLNHLSWNYFCVDFETSDLGLFRGYRKVSEEFIPDGEWIVPHVGRVIAVNMHTVLQVVK